MEDLGGLTLDHRMERTVSDDMSTFWVSTEFTFPGWGPWEPEWWSDYDSPAKLAASWGYCGA